MNFDTTGLKLKKAVQDADGHIFDVDWDSPKVACPTCGDVLNLTINHPKVFRAYDLANSQALNTPKRILIVTPNTLTRIYFVYKVNSMNEVNSKLFQTPTVTANGTQTIISNNNDDNDISVPELQLYEDPTVTAEGTNLSTKIINGMQYPRSMDLHDTRRLKQNTIYQLKITPTVAACDISTEIAWIEVK